MSATLLKLDELIRAVDGAGNRLVQLEEMSGEDLARLPVEFQRLQCVATRQFWCPGARRAGAIGSPEVSRSEFPVDQVVENRMHVVGTPVLVVEVVRMLPDVDRQQWLHVCR